MKKLISLLFAFVLTVPMWATWSLKADYGFNQYGTSPAMSAMGKIGASKTTSLSYYTSAQTASYISNGSSAKVGAQALSGYEFIGWFDGSGANANLITKDNPYTYSGANNENKILYARFQKIAYTETGTKPATNPTKSYTANSKSCSVTAYDLNTGDGIYWGDRALGATSTTTIGLYYQYGNPTPCTGSANSSYNYTGVFTTTNALPADCDPVTVALGEGWRTPTGVEYAVMLGTATVTRASGKQTITAVSNNKTINLYAGGHKYDYSVSYNSGNNSNGGAYYWSSTIKTSGSNPSAYRMKLSNNSTSPNYFSKTAEDNIYDEYAQQIQPVYDYRTYTLTVKGKDGSTTLKTQTGKWGSTVTVEAPNDITGYEFEKWNDGNTTRKRTFKVCNITYTAIYKSSSANYTVKHYKQNLELNGYDEVTADQQTLSGTPGASTSATAKSYTGFTAQSFSQGTINADGSTVVSIYYNRNKYTVTVESSNTNYGTVDVASVANVPYGTTITTSTNTIDVNGTTITATPATVTGYTCTFTGWTGTATVTGALTVTANFTQTANNYSVTFRKSADDQNPAVKSDYHYGDEITNCPSDLSAQKIGFVFTGWYLDGAVPEVRYTSGMTVTGNMIFTARYSTALSITIPAYENHGKVLVHTIDRTYTVTSDGNEDEEKIIYVASGSRITIEPVADAYFHFAGWTPNPGEYLDGNFIEIDNVQSNITYTPTWEQNVALPLVDTENEAYYTALYRNATYAGKMLTVTMTGRRLTAGSWMTFCAPFEFDIPAGHPMDGAVYRFINGTMTGSNTEGYISLDFRRTHKIEANVPYLVVAKTTTDTDLEFDGVTIEDDPEQKPVVASSGDVQFVSQPWKDALVNEALELADFYIASGNTLRYAKVGDPGTTIRAFRAYFHRLRDLNATPAPRRIVISLDGVETTKEIGVDGEIEDTTRKYMENGILYIERNGVRYDAQGQRAE